MNTIKLPSGLEFKCTDEGAIIMMNAKTANRYNELYDKAIDELNRSNDLRAFDRMHEQVRKECDPQEVYFYEFNNHESMYAYDGDYEAIKLIIDIFGENIARKIKRYNAGYSIDYIMIPEWVKHTWLMLQRLIRDCDYYLGCGNRCAKHLWARDEEAQITEMRKLLAELPDEYKPEWLTSEKIDVYESKMLNLQPVVL